MSDWLGRDGILVVFLFDLFTHFLEFLLVASLVGIEGLVALLPADQFLLCLVVEELLNDIFEVVDRPVFELLLEVPTTVLAKLHEVLIFVLGNVIPEVTLFGPDLLLISIRHLSYIKL